jgi:hypothetical protein
MYVSGVHEPVRHGYIPPGSAIHSRILYPLDSYFRRANGNLDVENRAEFLVRFAKAGGYQVTDCGHPRRRKPIRTFPGAWRNLCACARVGPLGVQQRLWSGLRCISCACGGSRRYVGLIIHDLRRSAARALRRADVPESVIMATGG